MANCWDTIWSRNQLVNRARVWEVLPLFTSGGVSTSIGLGHRGEASILREKLLNDLKRLESFLGILFKNRLALAGLVIILVFFALSALAPVLVGAYPTPVQGSATLQPPSDAHRLGTDYQGRDILTLLLYGGRISLLIGFSASAVAD